MEMPLVIRDDDRECRNIRARKQFGDRAKFWIESLWGCRIVYCACALPKPRTHGKAKPKK